MRKPQLNLPPAVTDRLPDAIANRLPSTTPARRVTGKRLAVGGSIFAVVAALAAIGTRAARNRYVTGETQIKQFVEHADGAVIFLDDGEVFWASPDVLAVIKGYLDDDNKDVLLSYKLDRVRRHTMTGLPTGSVDLF